MMQTSRFNFGHIAGMKDYLGERLESLVSGYSMLTQDMSGDVVGTREHMLSATTRVSPTGVLPPRASPLDKAFMLEKANIERKTQDVLSNGHPLLNEVRNIVLERLIGPFFKYVTDGRVAYFTPTPSNTPHSDVRLIKTRVKSASRLLRKMFEGRTLTDGYGLTIVGRTWDVVDRKIRPFLEDAFFTLPSYAKFYRGDSIENVKDYAPFSLKCIKSSGYEAEHLLILYPTDGRGVIPIDVHLQSLDAFVASDFGRAVLPEHFNHFAVKEAVMEMMGIRYPFAEGNTKDDNSVNVAGGMQESKAGCMQESNGRKSRTWYFGRGYGLMVEKALCEKEIRAKLPVFYKGVSLSGFGLSCPPLNSTVVDEVIAAAIRDNEQKLTSDFTASTYNARYTGVLTDVAIRLTHMAADIAEQNKVLH